MTASNVTRRFKSRWITILNKQSRIRTLFCKRSFSIAVIFAASFFTILSGAAISNDASDDKGPGHKKTGVALLPPEPPLTPHKGEALSKGKFLIASEKMNDPRFSETVILLVDYGLHGASGLIINKPTKIKLSHALPKISGIEKRQDELYYGGPVETHNYFMLIRSGKAPEGSKNIFGNVYINTSGGDFERMIKDDNPSVTLRVYAGYAGWAPLQLDKEAALNGWYIKEADEKSIFEDNPPDVWRRLAPKRLGAGGPASRQGGRQGGAAGSLPSNGSGALITSGQAR